MSWVLSTTGLLHPTTPVWLEDMCQRLLENNDTYKTVELIHPRMDDRDAKTFAKALSENTTITTLVLSCYAIVDDGTAAIASVLCENKTITKLQLRDLRDVREISTFFQYLQRNQTITDMSLRHCTICPRGAMIMAQYMKNNKCLQELRITDSQFICNAFQILCEQGLYRHSSIQRIYFVNDDLSNDTSAEYLANLFDQNCIQELHLGENNLGDDGVATIVKKIIQNKVVALSHLDLRSNSVTSIGAMSMQGLIVNNIALRSLNFSDNEIGDSGMMALARGLQHQHYHRLCKLDVSMNHITKNSATAIAKMLQTNQSLQELNLSFNSLCDDGVAVIVSALAKTQTSTTNNHHRLNTNSSNVTLRTLSFRRNGITNIGARRIATFLPYMDGLKELLLSKNGIDSIGIAALLSGLQSNVQLEYLDVDYTKMASSSNVSLDAATTTATDWSNSISSSSSFLQREMLRCMKLNKAGRRIFRSINVVPRSLWPFIFGRISTDADLVYHFLSTKPDIIQSLPTALPNQCWIDDPMEHQRNISISDSIIGNTTKKETEMSTTKASHTNLGNTDVVASRGDRYQEPFFEVSTFSSSILKPRTTTDNNHNDDNNDDNNKMPKMQALLPLPSLPFSSRPFESTHISSPKRKKQKQHINERSSDHSIGTAIRTCVTF